MGVIIGVIVGYVMGTKSGETGLAELKEAWKTIRSSDEAKEIMAGGLSMAAGLISRGGGLLAERLQTASSSSPSVTALRPTG
jgi:hypothetical protein